MPAASSRSAVEPVIAPVPSDLPGRPGPPLVRRIVYAPGAPARTRASWSPAGAAGRGRDGDPGPAPVDPELTMTCPPGGTTITCRSTGASDFGSAWIVTHGRAKLTAAAAPAVTISDRFVIRFGPAPGAVRSRERAACRGRSPRASPARRPRSPSVPGPRGGDGGHSARARSSRRADLDDDLGRAGGAFWVRSCAATPAISASTIAPAVTMADALVMSASSAHHQRYSRARGSSAGRRSHLPRAM